MPNSPAANIAPAHPIADSASMPAPWSYAHQYHDGIRFSHGQEINGNKPIKAIGLYLEEDVRAIVEALRAERERCATVADKEADLLLFTAARLGSFSQARKPFYTEAELHEQAGTAVRNVADKVRAGDA